MTQSKKTPSVDAEGQTLETIMLCNGQDHFIQREINVNDLLIDLKYIDTQIESLKDQLRYIARLIEAFNREMSQKGEVCQH